MQYIKSIILVSSLAINSAHSVDFDFKKVALYSAGFAVVGGTVYGAQWLMKQENRSYRALDNAKAQLLELQAVWAGLGINVQSRDTLQDQIVQIATNGKQQYTSIYATATSSGNQTSVSTHMYKPSAIESIKHAMLDLEFNSYSIDICLLQIDYCLKHYTSTYHDELKAIREDLVMHKDINQEILAGLKPHMHGMLNSFGYNIGSALQRFGHRFIARPLHPIF